MTERELSLPADAVKIPLSNEEGKLKTPGEVEDDVQAWKQLNGIQMPVIRLPRGGYLLVYKETEENRKRVLDLLRQ